MAWIKIDRAIIDSFCFANPKHFKIWIWLLAKANYKKTYASVKVGVGYSTVEVGRGQLIFGRIEAEEELEMDGSFIYRTLKKFEEIEQIKIKSAVNYSLITICNYETYQDKNPQNSENSPPIDFQLNGNYTTNEFQLHDNRSTTARQVNTSKEVLEVKEYKEGKERKEIRGFVFSENFEEVFSNNGMSKKLSEEEIEKAKNGELKPNEIIIK